MFKNDRFMTIITGLVLAIFAGTMVRYSDRIMAMMAGENQIQTHDDFYSVRSGSSQTLDLLANDDVIGPVVLLSQPGCGAVSLAGDGRVQFSDNSACSGEVFFAYCVESGESCDSNGVTINVVAIAAVAENAEATPVENADVVENNTVAETGSQPIEIVSADPVETSAPQVQQLTLSIQAPVLAAPTVDEFLSPSAATAGIRIQSALVAETPQNLDQNIIAQSSAAAADNTEIVISGFTAPVIEDSGASGISIGSAAADDIIQPNEIASVSGSLVVSGQDAPIGKIESGPVALANLPQNTQSGFGNGNTPFEESPPAEMAVASSVTLDTSSDTQVLAQLDNQASDPLVVATGPTALIALQVVGAPNGAGNIGEDMSLILSEPGAQTLAAMLPVPQLQAQDNPGEEDISILEREPASLILVPEINQEPAAIHLATSDIAGLFVLREEQAAPVIDVFITDLQKSIAESGNNSLTTVFSGFGIDQIPSLVQAPVLTPQLFSDSANAVILASLQTGLPAIDSLQSLASLPGVDLQLPSVDLAPAPAPVSEPDIEVASLDASNSVVPDTGSAVAQNSTCDIALDISVRSGANILLFVTADCKPLVPVTISHSGIEFTILTDEAGTANVEFPAMERAALITATFEDGSTAETSAIVPRIDEVTRAAVTWRGTVNLDLHALEYGAARGTEGHVWSGAARDPRTARVNGGGYLDVLGDPDIEGGAMAEVYTMPLGRSQQRGVVVMSLEIQDGTPVCGTSITASTIRTQEQDGASSRSIRFKMLSCDQNQTNITIPRAVADIRLAGR